MTDHWDDGWPAGGPGFDDEGGPGFDDADRAGPAEPFDGYGAEDGYPVEGFGPAGDGSAADDETPGNDGFSADDHNDGFLGGGDTAGPASPVEDAESGMGPADPAGEVGFGPAGPPVGADPDLDPYRDAESWPEPAFPDPVGPGPAPDPVDGFPWADPAALGGTAEPLPAPGYSAAPHPGELADYAATELPAGDDPWAALAASDDPATSALARFWSPRAD